MANPIISVFTKDVITKVASAVTHGVIHILDRGACYSHSYRMTGFAPPTDFTEFQEFSGMLFISAASNIDVYILALGADGTVRVDL